MNRITIPLALAGLLSIASQITHADIDIPKTHHKSKHCKVKPFKGDPKPVEAKTDAPKNLTGTFDITSNYLFRGISQSNNLPAFQGGLTYTFLSTGIYFNFWGSNVNLTDTIHNNDVATLEIDTIGGIKNTIKDFTYDINIDRYNYPKATGLNYNELIGVLTYKIFTITLGYSTNVYDTHYNGFYSEGAVNLPVPPKYAFNMENVIVTGAFGHYGLQKPAGNSYNNYYVQISKAINNFTLALQYAATNNRLTMNSLDGQHVVATVTVYF